ncbi:MAG: serine/threonine protein kinase [Bryobacterales bacterium]|nr:serine/threonine protein kinase [Bryobacterales bacterium]
MILDPQSWPVVSRLLDEWLDLPEDQRPNWLQQLPPEYASYRPQLETLLRAGKNIAAGFLSQAPIWEETLPGEGEPDFAAGAMVGPYRLERELGRGGMAVVWLAVRADGTLRRTVALKLPLFSLRNRVLDERFARERDILARLSDARIARLYDAGIDASGQPYLALEYIDGRPITEFAGSMRLSLDARLRLFLDVLRAVQHAHSGLVVHRDLKPSNILVTAQGEVRLLDFGIAKILSEDESAESELTRIGGRLLTPDFASPEQIRGDPITTATDVYSLAVVLYELLAGGRPYRLKRQTRGCLEEAILEADPIPLSQARISPEAAQARGGLSEHRLRRTLRGDLDAILSKALAKAPQDRYITVGAFYDDILRYLQREPVAAQRAGSWYRTRKFISRRRGVVVSVAAVILSLAAGLGVALRETRIARLERRRSEAVQSFLIDIFNRNSTSQPDPVRARQTTARELLDTGSANIDRALQDAPEARLNMLGTLFHLYNDLGLKDHTVELGRKRVTLARSLYGENDRRTAEALVTLALSLGESNSVNDRKPVLDRAGRILDAANDTNSSLRGSYWQAAAAHYLATDPNRSAEAAHKAAAIFRANGLPAELLQALNVEGQVLYGARRYSDAVSALGEAAAISEKLQGAARKTMPAIYASLGDAQFQSLDFEPAEANYRRALDLARVIRGPEHEDVIQTQIRLGRLLVDTGKPDGLDTLRSALDLAIRTKGPDDLFHTGYALLVTGAKLISLGRPKDALGLLDRTIQVRRGARRTGTRAFAETLDTAALANIHLARLRRAAALLDESAAIHARLGTQAASGNLNFHVQTRARLLIAQGRPLEAYHLVAALPAADARSGYAFRVWLDNQILLAQAEQAAGLPAARVREILRRIAAAPNRGYLVRWENAALGILPPSKNH